MRTNEHGHTRDAASLEKEIDETRADVRATLEALEEKLSPGQVLDHAVELARRHGGSYAESLLRAARENPVATLMASFGLAWLMTAARPEDEALSRPAARVPHPRDRQPAVSGTDLALPARRETRTARLRSGLDQFIHDQPLVVGAFGVAVGALVGAALRATNDKNYAGDLIDEEDVAAREAEARIAAEEALRSSTAEHHNGPYGPGSSEPH